MQILGMFILAPALLFVSKDKEHLPRILRWFDNADYYRKPKGALIDGLSGDLGFRAQYKDPTAWWPRYYW